MAGRQGAGYAEEVADLARRDAKPKGVRCISCARWNSASCARPEDLHRIAYEYLEDAAAQGVRHAEVFWNPTGTARDSGIAYAAGADAILAAFDDAKHDRHLRLADPSIDPRGNAEEAADGRLDGGASARSGIIGLGIDYRENDGPPEAFWKAYRAAKQAGFRLTAHAGEFGCHWRNVETAIDLLEVERIDHGYTVLDNAALARRCADRGIVFTVVPTNSYYLRTLPEDRWATDHPIRRMPGAGLLIHPNTDDPPLHRVDPERCWHMMVKDFGFDLDDLRRFMLNGIVGAFIPEDDKRGLAATFTAEYDRLRAELDRIT